MTLSVYETFPAVGQTGSASADLVHATCCSDTDITMCALPDDGPFVVADVDCAVCLDLLKQWAEDAKKQAPTVPCRMCPKLRIEATR